MCGLEDLVERATHGSRPERGIRAVLAVHGLPHAVEETACGHEHHEVHPSGRVGGHVVDRRI